MAGSTVLCKTQLQKLKEHKYSAQGSSLSEKIFQPYWRYVVELMPLWLAPNTITSLGLALNFITSVAVIYLCPLAKGDVSLSFLCQHCFQLLWVLFWSFSTATSKNMTFRKIKGSNLFLCWYTNSCWFCIELSYFCKRFCSNEVLNDRQVFRPCFCWLFRTCFH